MHETMTVRGHQRSNPPLLTSSHNAHQLVEDGVLMLQARVGKENDEGVHVLLDVDTILLQHLFIRGLQEQARKRS